MSENIKNLEERAKNLARKKASLQQVLHMMEQLKLVPSVENLIGNILQILLENIGGQNLSIYYIHDDTINYFDILGARKIVHEIEDPLVQKAFESKQIVEVKHPFKDTLMLTPEFSGAFTWVFPLVFNKTLIGVIKIEGITGTRELRDELPVFFNYVSLLLTNQLQSEKLQWANQQLEAQLDEIQRTEEALRISEKRLNLALEAANEFWYELNYTTGEILLSDQIYYMLGYDKSMLIPNIREWAKLVHQDDREIVDQFIQNIPKMKNNDFFKIEFRMTRKNQDYIWLLCSGKFVQSQNESSSNIVTGTILDITESKIVHEKLKLSARVFEESSEGIIITDSHNNIISVNQSFMDITGYPIDEVMGKNPHILASGLHDRDFFMQMWQQIKSMGYWKGEIWNRRKDGSVYLAWLSISKILDSTGKVINFIGIFSDITYSRETEKHIEQLIYFDALTGLPNRTLLSDRIKQAINRAQREKETLAILFLDLDQFKHINDTLGHKIGDELLIEVANRFKEVLREGDTLSRFGGDEYIVLLPDTDMDGASMVAHKLLESNSKAYFIGEHELSITSSIGAALYPMDGQDLETLYRCADTAMYKAKKEGRNSFLFFTRNMQERSARNLQLLNAMRRALEKNEFTMFYQPQISIFSGEIIGAEALIRWPHPEQGFIPPSEFIPLAEESGLILPIGEWVLQAALSQLKKWLSSGIAGFRLAVNLSAIQLKQPDLPHLISQLLEEMKIPAEFLELELTESAAMENPDAAISMMDTLHKIGVKFAIDDFGTGYSSLSYLKRFRIDKLKIDHSFVSDLGKDPDDEAIVRAITGLAHSLKLHTLAEGVETKEQLDFLKDCGCHEVQGFLYSRALAPDEFEKWILQYKKNIWQS